MTPRASVDGDALESLFRALGNADRVRLVEEIAHGTPSTGAAGLTIAELAARVGISRFSASRHLGILREAGVLRAHRSGVRIIHSTAREAVELIEDWLYPLIDALDRGDGAEDRSTG